MGRGCGPAPLRDQRAELRPLQNLRHQGPEPEYHLGPARRRRRAELSEYVTLPLPRFRRRCGLKSPATREHVTTGTGFVSLRHCGKKVILALTQKTSDA